MSEDLRAAFARAAAELPDEPDRLGRVLARRRRAVRVRSAAAACTTVALVVGVALLVPSLRPAGTPDRAAAAPGDCAHGGARLSQDNPLTPLPPPTRGPDGSYPARSRVEMRLLPDCTTVRVGQEVSIRVVAVSDAASLNRNQLVLDGAGSSMSESCVGYRPGEEPPQPEPAPSTYDDTILHTYTHAKVDKVGVGLSTGCSTYSGQADASVLITVVDEDAPPVEPADAADLVGSWTVEGEDTTLVLGRELVLRLPCGRAEGGWTADSAQLLFLTSLGGSDQACSGVLIARGPAWLRAATSWRAQDDRLLLLDARGTVVARLLPAGRFDDDTTPEQRAVWAPVALPAEAAPVDLDALRGDWHPVVDPTGAAFVRFTSGGRYTGSDGCNSVGGPFLLGAAGRFLTVVAGGSAGVGCSGPVAELPVERTTRAGLVGGQLVLYDAQGAELARLRR